MPDANKVIDYFFEEQHRKWRERTYDRLCHEHLAQLRSGYEWWFHNADQKRPVPPYRDAYYPENKGLGPR